LSYRRAAACCSLAFALTGCGGGGGGGGGGTTPPTPIVTPPPPVTQTQTVSPAGGSVSVTLSPQTITVVVPSGALSTTGTVSVTLYPASAVPKTIRSTARRARSVGADAVLAAEFSVTISGATLVKPLQASLVTTAAPAGSIFRLAGFGTKFDDVDTVTYSGTTATSDLNVAWPRMSLASNTLYAFYTEPQAEGGTPAPSVSVSSLAPVPLGFLGTAAFVATEADANLFPYLDPSFSFSLDNISLGSINAATGLFSAGSIDGAGNVIATDTTSGRGNPSGKGAVSVSSQRPGNAGDSFTYTGTLSSTTQQTNGNITTQPQTDTAAVSLTATVDAAFAPSSGGGQNLIHSVEIDTYPLQTITTKTDSRYRYAPSGSSATLSILSSDAKDSNGAEFVNTYGTGNGQLDLLPETAGPFGPNNAALTYTETDPAGFNRQRLTAAAGSYAETGHDALGRTQSITQNADFSGTYDATQYSTFKFVVAAPSGSPPHIQMQVYRSGNPSGPPLSILSWIPTGLTQPATETDVDNGTTTYPPACNVPAKYGTSGNQIVQTIKRVDAPLGNVETQTTTTYIAPGVGPVCIQLTDATQTFYDYTRQNGNFGLFFSNTAVPIQMTSVSETLTLTSASTQNGTVTKSVGRASSPFPPSAFAPVAFARVRFEHLVRERLGGMREATFSRDFMSHGVQTL
jgi:hypothetical protein